LVYYTDLVDIELY